MKQSPPENTMVSLFEVRKLTLWPLGSYFLVVNVLEKENISLQNFLPSLCILTYVESQIKSDNKGLIHLCLCELLIRAFTASRSRNIPGSFEIRLLKHVKTMIGDPHSFSFTFRPLWMALQDGAQSQALH